MKVWSRYFPVVLTDDEGQKSIVLGELLLTFDIPRLFVVMILPFFRVDYAFDSFD